jgi:hypothetical protein
MDVYTENGYDYQEYTDEYKDEYKYDGLGFTTERYRLKEDYRYGKDSLLLEKYDDTAISEIGFGGIDATAYCIAEGTLIACPGGFGTKKIETLTVGDEVYCYDTDSQTTGISKIKTIQMVSHDHLLRISTQKS